MSIANFKRELWSAALLANFRKRLTAVGLAATDWQSEAQTGASAVNIIVPAAGSVAPYSGSISWSDVTSSTYELALDQKQYIAFKVDDADQAQSHISIINSYVEPNSEALASAVDTYIYSLANGYTGGAAEVEVDISDVDALESVYGAMLEAGENLDNAGAPQDGRFVVASGRFLRALKQGTDWVGASELGDSMRVTGAVGMVNGFEVVPSNNFYTSGNGTSTDLYHHLFYGVKGSIAFALRLNGQPEAVRLPDAFADGIRMLTMYGAEVIRPTALGVVKALVVDVA